MVDEKLWEEVIGPEREQFLKDQMIDTTMVKHLWRMKANPGLFFAEGYKIGAG